MAIKALDLELSEELEPVLDVKGYSKLLVLVRYRGRPLGWTRITPCQPIISADRLRRAIGKQLGWELVPTALGGLFNESVAATKPPEPISVVICTRGQTDQLACCLHALTALDYQEYEIIVVDSAPRRDDTGQLTAQLPVRYVREERPGLNWARNRGIAEAQYDIIAFTDDATRVDRGWLRAIGRAFEKPEVMAVTGLVAPAELETEAQIHFELNCGGMGRGFRRRRVRGDKLTARRLLWANTFGFGSNMAFRRQLFAEAGPFDPALGSGTPSGGGGDFELFHRLLSRGYTLVYEPAALVWHFHPRDRSSLRRLFYNRGRSFGAYLLTCARNRTVSRGSILRFAFQQWLGASLFGRLCRPRRSQRRLVALEFVGALLSPLGYGAARVRVRQIASAHEKSEAKRCHGYDTGSGVGV